MSNNIKTKTSFILADPRITGKKQTNDHKEKRALKLRKKIIVNCEICKKIISRVPSQIKNLKHHFCSRKCYLKFHATLDNKKSYNQGFPLSLKNKIRKRDNLKCCLCMKNQENKKHDVHHIDYNKHNNIESNLITLCKSCHSRTNHGIRSKWVIIFKNILSITGGIK